MAVPKRRKSKSRSRTARAHQAMSRPTYIKCPNCGAIAQPHRACANCGFFQGRVVVEKEST